MEYSLYITATTVLRTVDQFECIRDLDCIESSYNLAAVRIDLPSK